MINLPEDFVHYTSQLFGDREFQSLAESLQTEAPVSIRKNPNKWQEAFETSSLETVPWANEGGCYLSERPAFTFDPLFHAGCYYVQEASSMFVQQVLRKYVPCACRMLDLCAAPGGKSTLARAALPQGSLLVSNEIIRNRAQILAENMVKWGHPDVVVTHNAPADFIPLNNFFDVILADVPCSGEGMFRKDEDAVKEWSLDNVDTCWRRQREIVMNVWDCLKPGGLFIYSTCTFNTLENEDNVRWMVRQLGAEPLEVPMSQEWGILGDITTGDNPLPVYRFLPSHVKGEGFFLAVMRKPMGDAVAEERAFLIDNESEMSLKSVKRSKTTRTKGKEMNSKSKKNALPSYDACRSWLVDSETYAWQVVGETIVAIPNRWSGVLEQLRQYLTVLHAGVSVASLKGHDWMPHHSLAMSLCLEREAFPRIDVGYENAIAYLRHEAVVLDISAPRGYLLLIYKGIPLGFVKNVGNRANNLYPTEWRIRSGYVPLESKE